MRFLFVFHNLKLKNNLKRKKKKKKRATLPQRVLELAQRLGLISEGERRAVLNYFCVPIVGSAWNPERPQILAYLELKQCLEVIIQVRIFRLELLVSDTSLPAPQ